jgi:uncharacterized damage-inducible protein DinB
MHSDPGRQTADIHRAPAGESHQKIELMAGQGDGAKSGVEGGNRQPGCACDMAEDTSGWVEIAFADEFLQRGRHGWYSTAVCFGIDRYLHMQLNIGTSLHAATRLRGSKLAFDCIRGQQRKDPVMTERETFLHIHARECKVTHDLLKAFPATKLDLRPHEKSRSARELAFVLANQELFYKQAAEGAIDPATFGKLPPSTWDEIIRVLEANHSAVDAALENASEEDLNKTFDFAGQTMRRLDALWANLFDHIHHRGQFSVYLRMSGAKVPSIYGPTADDKQPAAA